MNTIDDFVALIRDELGLPVSVADVGQPLDELPGWDSMHVLWLLIIMERTTGRSIPLPDILDAGSLVDIYALAAE